MINVLLPAPPSGADGSIEPCALEGVRRRDVAGTESEDKYCMLIKLRIREMCGNQFCWLIYAIRFIRGNEVNENRVDATACNYLYSIRGLDFN